jgi:predicted phage-related endonuclease
MTTAGTASPVPLDDLATWVQLYADMNTAIAALEEKKKAARDRIEAALGDAETGTVAGVPVIRWAHVTSTRLDQRKAKQLLGDRVDEAMVETTSRRFVLVDPDEQP